MTNKQNSNETDWLSKGNRRAMGFVVGIGIIAASAFAVQAFAESKTYAHFKLYTSEDVSDGGGGPLQLAGWRERRSYGFSRLSDAEIEERVTRLVRHAGIEIDATPEQEAQIIALLTPAIIDMRSMRGDMRETGMEFFDLLTAPTVDRAAVEALRAEKLAEMDAISKEWTDVMTDVAMVLTAEQRQLIDERVEQFRSRSWWRRH